MRTERIGIDRMHPAAYNPRVDLQPGDPEYEHIKSSIEEFGYIDPIIWNERTGNIVGGHQRYKILVEQGNTELDVVVVDMDEQTEKAANMALNKAVGLWDEAKVKDLLEELRIGFDMGSFGFDMDKYFPPEAQEDDYDAEAAYEAIDEARTRRGDIYILGNHRLMCGDSTSHEDMEKLMGGGMADLVVTDPPYNVNYGDKAEFLNDYLPEKAHRIESHILNDNMDDESFYNFLRDFYITTKDHMREGAAIYVFHAEITGHLFREALLAAGLKLSQCIIWEKNTFVMGRQDYQWKHEPCQPAGTKVLTPNGEVPIESLKDGNRVVSYYSMQNEARGFNKGLEIKTASRHYEGTLYGVCAAGRRTWATNNHEFSVKFNPETSETWCTYIMRRGDWWRIGITRTYDARGFGLKHRFDQEHAEEAWLVDTFSSQTDAQLGEQLLAVKYGIPYTYWEPERGQRHAYIFRTTEQIASFYAQLDLRQMKENALRLLKDFGRDPDHPLVNKILKRQTYSRRVTARIQACNLIPNLMKVPVLHDDRSVTFECIDKIEHKDHSGPVYSLAVKSYQHYVADGIITHNCLYRWKEGAAHYFTDDRTQSTVVIINDEKELEKMKKPELLEYCKKLSDYMAQVKTSVIYENKPTKNDLHPTMKPIRLIGRLINNSSKAGWIVLDPFGGSGSTMMAAEETGRHARLMELDPKYCDVIVDRWEQLTGKKATRLEAYNG